MLPLMTAVSVALALSNWKTLAMSMFDSNTLPQLECFSGFESVALDAETSSTLLQFVTHSLCTSSEL